MANALKIRRCDTDADLEGVRAVRQQVYIEEEHLPENLALDDFFSRETHILALAGSTPVGCASVIVPGTDLSDVSGLHYRELHTSKTGRIGKVIVIPEHRVRFLPIALMTLAFEFVIEHSPDRIIIAVYSHKQGLVEDYRHLGFTDLGVEKVGESSRKVYLQIDHPTPEHERRLRRRMFEFYRGYLDNIDPDHLPIAADVQA